MTYIIHPSWFYFLHLVSGIRALSFVALILLGITTIVFFAFFAVCFADYGMDDEDTQKFFKAFKKLLVALVFVVIVNIVVPSKETLIEMQVARYATVENAEWTLETIRAAVDYVVEAIKSLK